MNVFSVHSNFSPVTGKICNIWYHKGRFLNAALDKSSRENERNAVHVRTQGGEDVVFVQIAGLVARRIICHVGEGERIVRGQRYGFIRFGSRVDVHLPVSATPVVGPGDRVMSGNDIIASLEDAAHDADAG